MYQRTQILFIAILTLFNVSAQEQIHMQGTLEVGAKHRNTDSTSISHAVIGLNTYADSVRGVQMSALHNMTDHLHGFQIAGLFNMAGKDMLGTQIATVTNIARSVNGGIQLSPLSNIAATYMRGLQLGGYNYADTLTGVQIGLLNVARSHPYGVQIGVVNYTNDNKARKIGLVNLNPETRIDLLAFLSTTTRFNAALRFRNRSSYSIIGVGSHYMGLDHKFSGAIYYRLGQYFYIAPRWTLSGDVGFHHVETFEHNSRNKPQRLYSIRANANVDYQVSPTLGIFGSVGYGDTRHYGGGSYRHGLFGEMGVSLRWRKNQGLSTDDWFEQRARHGIPLPDDSLAHWNDNHKNYWRSAAETAGINVFVHCFDRFILNADFAQVKFRDISSNFKHAFVWDNDKFSTNLFAHPYHGNLYFNAARSNGLSFWQSAPYSVAGSLMWEFFGEKDPPTINDLFATSMGGMAIGEVFHRISELALDDRARGFHRFLREMVATVINPMGGFNRIIDGDAWRVRSTHNRYYDPNTLPLDFSISVGTRYLSDDGALFRGEANPYVTFYLEYGDPLGRDFHAPYDYFTLETSFGLSSNQPLVNRLHILGRLWSRRIESEKATTEWGIYQHFNYYDSKPVEDGTQLTPYRISEAASFGPGVIMRLPKMGVFNKLEQRVFLSGILLGGTKSDYYNIIDRDYNMGSGFSVKTKTHLELRHFGRFVLKFNYFRIFTWKGYEDKDLATIDPVYLNAQGDRGNAQLLEVNPIWEFDFKGPLSVNLSSSYFYRSTHYHAYPSVEAKTFEAKLGVTYHF